MRQPFYDAGGVTLYQGHVLDELAALPARSVQCCVTSPPYWGLRAYGTEPQVWGNGHVCAHEWSAVARPRQTGGDGTASLKQVSNTGSQLAKAPWPVRTCVRCQAIECELGSEPTPEAFIAHLTEVFRAVHRVLKDDGCLFVNIGDSYAGSGKGPTGHNGIGDQERRQGFTASKGAQIGSEHGESGHTSGVTPPPGYKPKDLIGVPWLLAFALRADGWWLRGDYIWAKPNPMPESVTDRCTRSHEYVFHFTKAARYYWNADAIREPASPTTVVRAAQGNGRAVHSTVSKHAAWPGSDRASDRSTLHGRDFVRDVAIGRNKRSVWTIPTEAYPAAHFATYPTALVEPCILAASRPGDVVLDPFSGSGTTLMVAQHLERRGWGVELNPEYCALAVKRFGQPALPLEVG